jgi:hypothetical protein
MIDQMPLYWVPRCIRELSYHHAWQSQLNRPCYIDFLYIQMEMEPHFDPIYRRSPCPFIQSLQLLEGHVHRTVGQCPLSYTSSDTSSVRAVSALNHVSQDRGASSPHLDASIVMTAVLSACTCAVQAFCAVCEAFEGRRSVPAQRWHQGLVCHPACTAEIFFFILFFVLF